MGGRFQIIKFNVIEFFLIHSLDCEALLFWKGHVSGPRAKALLCQGRGMDWGRSWPFRGGVVGQVL